MGIFYNYVIYGLKIVGRAHEDDDWGETLLEHIADPLAPLSNAEKKALYQQYKQARRNEWKDVEHLSFYMYTQGTSTLDLQSTNFMGWAPIELNTFLVEFNC